MFVLDTNAIIYHLSGDKAVEEFVLGRIAESATIFVPTIVAVEFLSYPAADESEISRFDFLVSRLEIAPLDLAMARIAGKVRKDFKISLGDAVIAATALAYGATLVTRNAKDFKKVKNLRLFEI